MGLENTTHAIPENWVVRIPEPGEVDAIQKTRQIIETNRWRSIAAIIIETITGGNGVVLRVIRHGGWNFRIMC